MDTQSEFLLFYAVRLFIPKSFLESSGLETDIQISQL